MLKKLSYYLFKKRFHKHQVHSIRNSAFVNYLHAKSILLIFESNFAEKNTRTKRIIEGLIADGKKVVAIGYVHKNDCISATYPEYQVLCKKDLSIFGKPKNFFLRQLVQNEYDLLIDITKENILPLEYIALYANAKCKAGMQKNDIKLYDFSLQMDDYLIANELLVNDLKCSFVYAQLLFYLKNIQSKDY